MLEAHNKSPADEEVIKNKKIPEKKMMMQDKIEFV